LEDWKWGRGGEEGGGEEGRIGGLGVREEREEREGRMEAKGRRRGHETYFLLSFLRTACGVFRSPE
jgi:hypothetical protein